MPQTPYPQVEAPSSEYHPPATKKRAPEPLGMLLSSHASRSEMRNPAEVLFLQKQIQLQTQMIFVLQNGEQVEGVIDWFDRDSIKIRGRARMLIYKSAIKYLFKRSDKHPIYID